MITTGISPYPTQIVVPGTIQQGRRFGRQEDPDQIQWDWNEDLFLSQDTPLNRELSKQALDVNPPDPNSQDFIDSTFYRIRDCRYSYFGILYHFDVYSSREILTREKKHNSDYVQSLIRALDEEKKITQDPIHTELFLALERTRQNALEKRNEEAMRALTFLRQVALSGKKIVCVFAHGGPDDIFGDPIWRLFGFKDKGIINANKVAYELSQQYNEQEVGAIFICACNQDGIPVDMGSMDNPTKIPVVAFTTDHNMINPLVKIYWPPEQN